MAASVSTAAGAGVRFQIYTAIAAKACSDPVRRFDVTDSAGGNGARARNLTGQGTIQKNAAERGGQGAGTAVGFGSNSKNQ